MICHNCGKEFEGHKRKFCETKCKTRYHNRKAKDHDLSVYETKPPTYNQSVYINCELCGTEFKRTKSGGANGNEYTRYCSVSCGVKSYYNSGEVAKSRIEKNRLLFISKEIAGIKKLKKNIDNRNRRIISEAYTYAKHNHCRTCGGSIAQSSKKMCTRYCDICKNAKKEAYRNSEEATLKRRLAKRIARKKGLTPLGNDRSRAKFYGVAYEPIKRKVVFDKAGWMCESCRVKTPKEMKGKSQPNSPELDHIIPISKGGSHTYDNVQLLCRKCNFDKLDNYPIEYAQTPLPLLESRKG